MVAQLFKKVPALKLTFIKAVPYLNRFVACFPLRRPGFDPMLNRVGFVVGKVAVTQGFSSILVSPANSPSIDCSTFIIIIIIIIYHPGLL
jgi:hypothetical protein